MITLNCNLRSVALAATLALFPLAQTPAQDDEKKEPESGKKIDPKAMELMEALAERYSGAASFSGEAKMSIKQSLPEALGGMERNQSITHSLFRKGAKFAQVAKGESEMPLEFYADGSKVTLKLDDETAIQNEQTGSVTAAIKSEDFGFQKEAGSNMILDQHMPGAFLRSLVLNDKDHPWQKKVVGLSLEGEEEIDGKPVRKLKLVSEQNPGDGGTIEMVTHVWIGGGDEPVLMKVEQDMSGVIKKMAEQNPSFADVKIEMTGEFTAPELGGEIADDVFAADLAEDAKVFASFAKLIESMQAEQAAGRPDPTELVGKEAPEVELALLDGEAFKLSANKGKVVILDFWATWCGPCVQALPVLMEVSGKFADKGVKLVAVNQQEEEKPVSAFLKKNDWDLTVAMDKDGKVAKSYMVSGIPQTVIVGKDGKVKKVHVGFSPGLAETLTEELKEILGE